MKYESINYLLPETPEGIELFGYTENRMIVLKITVRETATSGLHEIVLPNELASQTELYFAKNGQSDVRKSTALIIYKTIRVNIPENHVATWMAISYPMHIE